MAYYKLKDLIGEEIIIPSGGKVCVHCGLKIKKSDSPVAFKFFSKNSIYTHFKCRKAFKETLT